MSQIIKAKHLLCTIIVSMFVFNTILPSVNAPPVVPSMSVEPPSIVNETLVPGSSFSVDIMISDVVNLGGYEFKLGYDPDVLTATGFTYIDDPNFFYGHFQWHGEINLLTGYVWLVVTLPFGSTEGVDGTGTVVTIDFTVDDYGETTLSYDYSELGEIGTADPIVHDAISGYFRNLAPDGTYAVNLVGRSGWPKVHHFVVARHGSHQTLNAKVCNIGTETTMFYVSFEVVNATDDSIIETLTTPPESITVAQGKIDVDTMWTVVNGKFMVYVQCWYQHGQTLEWIPGAKLKRFSFAVIGAPASTLVSL